MPIKALLKNRSEDRPKRVRPRGRLRKGGAKGTSARGKWKGGDDLAGFRFTSEEEGIQKLFKFYYPAEFPTTIRVILPFDTIDECFPTQIEKRDAKTGKLLWTADGEMTTGRYIQSRDVWSTKKADQIPMPEYDEKTDKTVKWVGRLYVCISEMGWSYPSAVFLMQTTGKCDCYNIDKELTLAMRDNNGSLKRLHCQLYRTPGMLKMPSGKKRLNHFVHIETTHSWLQRTIAAAVPIKGQYDESERDETDEKEPTQETKPPQDDFVDPIEGATGDTLAAPKDYSELYTMAGEGEIPTIKNIPDMVNWIKKHCGQDLAQLPIEKAWAQITKELFSDEQTSTDENVPF